VSDTHMRKLKQLTEGLLEIPANEQCIGHFQVAMKDALTEIIEELEKIRKVIGI
jgi:hypothetical protein